MQQALVRGNQFRAQHRYLITPQIIRRAIEQTLAGDSEAARACGLSVWAVQRQLVLPGRGGRRALPTYGNEVIFTVHCTALRSWA